MYCSDKQMQRCAAMWLHLKRSSKCTSIQYSMHRLLLCSNNNNYENKVMGTNESHQCTWQIKNFITITNIIAMQNTAHHTTCDIIIFAYRYALIYKRMRVLVTSNYHHSNSRSIWGIIHINTNNWFTIHCFLLILLLRWVTPCILWLQGCYENTNETMITGML